MILQIAGLCQAAVLPTPAPPNKPIFPWQRQSEPLRKTYFNGLVSGKSTGNHRFFPLNMGLSCKFSLKPIHRILGGFPYHPPIILYGLRVLAQACQNSIRCWSWKGDSPLLTLFSLHLPTRCLGNPRNQWRRRSLGKSSHYFWGGWIPASHDWWHQRVPR